MLSNTNSYVKPLKNLPRAPRMKSSNYQPEHSYIQATYRLWTRRRSNPSSDTLHPPEVENKSKTRKQSRHPTSRNCQCRTSLLPRRTKPDCHDMMCVHSTRCLRTHDEGCGLVPDTVPIYVCFQYRGHVEVKSLPPPSPPLHQ